MAGTEVRRIAGLDGVTGRLPELARKVAVPQSDGVINWSQGFPAPSIIEGTTMEYYAGIDVSLESSIDRSHHLLIILQVLASAQHGCS